MKKCKPAVAAFGSPEVDLAVAILAELERAGREEVRQKRRALRRARIRAWLPW